MPRPCYVAEAEGNPEGECRLCAIGEQCEPYGYGLTAWELGCSSPCPGCESTGPEHLDGCDGEES